MTATHNKRPRDHSSVCHSTIEAAERDLGTAPAAQNQYTKKKKLALPTLVTAGQLPHDLSTWDNALLLIDKPQGWTSFDVCGKLRGALAALLRRRAKYVKVGHAGTLDPMATGLLIVCVGKGTKAIEGFMGMQKEYSGMLRLGEGTPSYDADTEVTQHVKWQHVTNADLLTARDRLLGEIEQVPPMFSAVRIGGKRLYEVARVGKEVERAARKVVVKRFDLHRESEDHQDVRLSVVCSKGTYVRSLAYDIGIAVGSVAHLTVLRREAIGEFLVKDAWNMDELVQILTEEVDKSRGTSVGGAELP